MQPTQSSLHKLRYGHKRTPPVIQSRGSSEDESATGFDDDQSGWEGTDDGPEKPAPVPAEDVEALTKQTRLDDSSWDDPATRWMVIPSAVGHRLLSEAHSSSRVAFHDFCKRRIPQMWRVEFPGGYQEVRFEYNTNTWYSSRFNIPGVPTYRILDNARVLRNEISHFSGRLTAATYDRLLRYAQEVAVALNDAPRAIKLRALREELRDVAAETLQEIENLGCASIVHVPHYWKPNHTHFFGMFEEYLGEVPRPIVRGFLYSPVVELAWKAWIWQQKTYGDMDEFLVEPEGHEEPEDHEEPEGHEEPDQLGQFGQPEQDEEEALSC
ncbi:hypothetical protein PG993_014856 [Apiospora rasikravindrae]|uniref:Uncharacterized protein n=1 Tax=Apiospora rasikravindrae TaxID=990691 RepID=A0ABR1RP60_9PEZI